MTTSTRRYPPHLIRDVLRETKTIAAVGVSANEARPSYFVMLYLQGRGYRVIPVNPAYAGRTLLGETVRASVADIPEEDGPIHMVDIFRRSDAAGAVVDEALDTLMGRGLRTIWMQIGVEDEAAAQRAEAAGLRVVMDRCPKQEHGRLSGELGAFGINTRVVSAKLR